MPRSKSDHKSSSQMKKEEKGKKNLASQKISRKTAPATTGVKGKMKKLRSRPGQAALRQIKKYQQSTDRLIRKAPLQRRIRQIASQYAQTHYDGNSRQERINPFRFQPQALRAIQQAVESSIVSLYEDAYLCTQHAKRITIFESDIRLARRIRGDAF